MAKEITVKRFKFTNSNIAALPANPKTSKSTDLEVSDTLVIGLKVLVGKNGNKKFLYRYSYNGKKRSIAIGGFGAFDVEEARSIANQYKALVAQGQDPKQLRDEKRSQPSFEDFAMIHYLPHANANKRSAKSDEAKLRLYLIPEFGEQPLAEISPQAIQHYQNRLITKLSPATANRHLSLLHRMFVLAKQWGYVESNPCKGISKFQENNKRQRFLNNDEIRALFIAADEDENQYAAAYVKFLLLTGIRRSEGLNAKWTDIQMVGEQKMLYVPHTKSGRSRYVMLNAMAIHILENLPRIAGNPYVFPGKIAGRPLNNPIKAFKRMINRAGIESSFRLHDIRHTVASLIINNGGTLYDVQAALAHANSKMSERYAHLSSERMRETSQNLSSVVSEAIMLERNSDDLTT